MEIPSQKSGVVKRNSIKLGDKVSEGDEILLLEVEGGSASAEEAPAEKPASEPAAADVAAKQDQASEEPLKGEQEGDGQAGESSIERSEEHTSELQSRENLVCRLLLEKKKKQVD